MRNYSRSREWGPWTFPLCTLVTSRYLIHPLPLGVSCQQTQGGKGIASEYGLHVTGILQQTGISDTAHVPFSVHPSQSHTSRPALHFQFSVPHSCFFLPRRQHCPSGVSSRAASEPPGRGQLSPLSPPCPAPLTSQRQHRTGRNPGAWLPGQRQPVGCDEASERERSGRPVLGLLRGPADRQTHR